MGADHAHEHAHPHAAQDHEEPERALDGRFRAALWLNVAIVAVQVVAGLAARSLGLLADAGHNLTDVASVAASMLAVRLARRPATANRSFGYHRATVIAAQANAAAMLVLTAVVVVEGVQRIGDAGVVDGPIVVAVALVAAVVNLLAVVVLRGGDHGHAPAHTHAHAGAEAGDRRDLNLRSAVLHLGADAAASLGVAAAGLVIWLTKGWYWLDPVASIVIAAVVGVQAWLLLRETVGVLLESTPRGLDVDALVTAMVGVDGVEAVHDVHVWTLASEVRALSAHLVLDGQPSLAEASAVGTAVKERVGRRFAISHLTFEYECESCRNDGRWCALSDHHGASVARQP